MYLESLYVKDFRNYSEQLVQFSSGKNLVLGKNGYGKTNLLEAIFMLSTSKSFRTPSDQKVKRWGTSGYIIRGNFNTEKGSYEITLEYDGEKKKFYVNRIAEQKLANIIGYVYSVLFSFDDILLITGPPILRRNYLDLVLSTVDPQYFSSLRTYIQLLKHKNRYLAEAYEIDYKLLETLNDQMVLPGCYITEKRAAFVNYLNNFLEEVSDKIGLFTEGMRVFYRSNILHNRCQDSIPRFEEFFRDELERKKETELKLKQALVGPHRDEIAFYNSSSEIRFFGSIGEARLTSIILRLAQASFYKKNRGCIPILLIDDILLELDRRNRERVLELFGTENQMIVTTTEKSHISEIFSWDRVFTIVEKGRIECKEEETLST